MATVTISDRRQAGTSAAQSGPSLYLVGGVAALLEALAIISTFVLFQIVQPAMGLTDRTWDEPSQAVSFVVVHQSYFTLVGLVLIISSLVVAPVVLALRARLRDLSPGLVGAATLFGAIGAALLLLNAVGQYAEFREFGLVPRLVAEQAEPYANIAYAATTGAAQIGLGLWTLLLSWVALKHGGLPRWLGYAGLLIGVAYFAVLAGPPIGQLLSIPWFVTVGITLMRSPTAMLHNES